MNEQFTNKTDQNDEAVAKKLDQVAEQTHPNGQFAARLEEQLRSTYQPKTGWFTTFGQVSPTLRWVALMILLALVLSWSIRNLVPAPQPALKGTPTVVLPDGTMTATPEPVHITATPTTQEGGYDFRGAKLLLGQSLPESPNTAHVYLLNKQDQPATLEQARALADRFGIHGEVYTEPNYIFNKTNYVFSDGKQSLSVYSLRFFTYISDLAKTSNFSKNTPNDNAEAIIREFLQACGFDFPFRITGSDFFDGYIVQPLAPDSIPMQYESFTQPSMIVMLDETGTVLRVDASLMSYDSAPAGEYEIISAQEALDKVLDDYAPAGKTEFVHSANEQPHDWYRSYPDNQPVTAYGHIAVYPPAGSGKPALVLMDGVPVVGNINGLEGLDHDTFVKVTGEYIVENGIRKLNVESWDRQAEETPFAGTLSRQGDQIILTSSDGSGNQYALIDPPADVPLHTNPTESSLEVYGVMVDGKLFWTFIRFFDDYAGGSGGGGGGGLGFYKLNLSGTPVPFPTATPKPKVTQENIEYVVKEGDTVLAIAETHGLTPQNLVDANPWLLEEGALMPGKTLIIPNQQQPTNNLPLGVYTIKEGDTLTGIAQNFGTTVDELIRLNNLPDTNIYIGQTLSVPITETTHQKMEDLRGYLSISIHNKSDGSSTKEYNLEVAQNSGGSTLYALDGPQLGALDVYNGLPIVVSGTINSTGKLIVESYKIPYPDLHFQILKGTQKAEQVGGQDVITFTTEDESTFVEFLASNPFPLTPDSFTGEQGDMLQQEVLILPDEMFGGLPVAHVYQSSMIQEGTPAMEIQANRINVINEPNDPMSSPDYQQPNLTINQVELVYFVSNPYYQVNDPNYDQRSPYIQPVWHFHGRFDDGTEFDMLIQALKEEFLLPELAPNAGMG